MIYKKIHFLQLLDIFDLLKKKFLFFYFIYQNIYS